METLVSVISGPLMTKEFRNINFLKIEGSLLNLCDLFFIIKRLGKYRATGTRKFVHGPTSLAR